MIARVSAIIACILLLGFEIDAQGCASFGFTTYYPRNVNGSETQTRANVLVSLTHPGVVTCAAFTPRTVVLPLPTVALIFEPMIDPFIAPENRTSVYKEDPVGRFFLARSTAVAVTAASTPVVVEVFVSYLQSFGSRNIHISCAAKCASNASVTAVSYPVAVMLTSFPGTRSFFFSASTILSTARQPTAFGQILDDGAVQFRAAGVPQLLTELTVMMDLPLDIKAFHDIDLTVVYPVRTIDAIFSTYILGLTDGATVWSLSVARTGVLAIQWPYYIPFTAAFSSQSLLFGQWSGDETATTIQIRYQFSRARNLVNITYARGNVTQNFKLLGPQAGIVSGPLRVITFSSSITQTYSHYNVHGVYTVSNYPANTTYVADYDPFTIASQVVSTEGTFQGMAALPAAVYRATSLQTKLLELPLPAPTAIHANSTTPFQVTISVADKPAGNNANNVAFGLSDGVMVWAAKRTTTLVAGIVVNMTSPSRTAVTLGPTSQNLQDTTPMCQGLFTYNHTAGFLSGATRAAMGWNAWNVSQVVSQGPLSVYVLHIDSTVVNHYFISARIDVTIVDAVRPTMYLRTLVNIAPVATNLTVVPLTVTFSEEVALVAASLPIQTVNCHATVPQLASNITTSEMNFTVSPLGDGVFSVWIGSGVVRDSANNLNEGTSNVVSFVRDTVGPSVTVIIGAPQYANASTLAANGTWTVTIVVSETPRTFLLAYLSVLNGNVTSLTRRPDLDLAYGAQSVVYTVSCAPVSQGYVNVSVPSHQFTDLADNVNLAGKGTVVFDTIRPTVTLTTSHPAISNVSVSVFTVTFSEHIVQFTANNVTVTNGVVSNVLLSPQTVTPASVPGQGGMTYSFEVTAVSDGLISVQIGGGAVADYALNPCTPSQTVVLRYDSSPPTVYIASHTLPWTNTIEKFTVTFNEWPFALTNSSFIVENCSVVGITLVSSELGTSFDDVYALNLPTVYEFVVVPLFEECDISVVLRAGGVTDRGRNGNVISNKFAFHFDSVPPTVVISTDTPLNANQFTVAPVFVTWSEPVRHFTPADVTVKRAEIKRISQPNGTAVLFWRVDIEAFTPGPDIYSDVRIYVASGVTQDLAGNGNILSYNGSIDDTSPRELRFQFHVILPKTFDFVPILLFCTAFVTIALVPVSYFAFISLRRRYYLKRGVYMEPVEALYASTTKATRALRDNVVLLQDYPSPFIVEVHAPELLEERKRFLETEQTRKEKREARRKQREEEEKLAKAKPKTPKVTKTRQRGGSKPRPGGKKPGSSTGSRPGTTGASST